MVYPFSKFAKFFGKSNISYPLICTCAYEGVRNVSFPKNLAYLLNGWPLSQSGVIDVGLSDHDLIFWTRKTLKLKPHSHLFIEILHKRKLQPFNDQCSCHIETNQLIYRANQLTGFYMMGTLIVKRLRKH